MSRWSRLFRCHQAVCAVCVSVHGSARAPYVVVIIIVVVDVVIVPTHRTKASHDVHTYDMYGLYYIILGYEHTSTSQRLVFVCVFVSVCVCIHCMRVLYNSRSQRNLHYNNLATVIVWMHSTHTAHITRTPFGGELRCRL